MLVSCADRFFLGDEHICYHFAFVQLGTDAGALREVRYDYYHHHYGMPDIYFENYTGNIGRVRIRSAA
jgi:hypothetical protein